MASVTTTKDVSAPVESTSRAGRLVASVLLYVAVTVGAVIMIMPFAWMLLGSVKDLGQLYKVPPNWIPYALFNAFGVFLLRQFIKSLPVDLEEAAIVDGANRWTIYWRIILPLIRPALAAFGIFTFLFQWNNFFRPLVFLNSIDNYTVPLAINFFRGQYATDFALLMAGSAISIVPVLIVYIIGQRHIIEGIATTGMKQ